MSFRCCDCGDTITGQQILDGEHLHIVEISRENPPTWVFRCACCHAEWLEKFRPE
jgi:hypothetical protein